MEQIIPTKATVTIEFEQLYRIYKLEFDAIQPEYKIENIRFEHDPDWRKKWTSMQFVGDAGRSFMYAQYYPLHVVVNYFEDRIFWTGFDLANQKSRHTDGESRQHLCSLPPLIAAKAG